MAKRNYFSKKPLHRLCTICKGPNPFKELKNDSPYCEICLTKRCAVCGKIRLFQCRFVEFTFDFGPEAPHAGNNLVSANYSPTTTRQFTLCGKHFSAFQRFRMNALNLVWPVDKQMGDFMERLKFEVTHQRMQNRIANGEVVPQSENPDLPNIDEVIERMLSGGVKSED